MQLRKTLLRAEIIALWFHMLRSVTSADIIISY